MNRFPLLLAGAALLHGAAFAQYGYAPMPPTPPTPPAPPPPPSYPSYSGYSAPTPPPAPTMPPAGSGMDMGYSSPSYGYVSQPPAPPPSGNNYGLGASMGSNMLTYGMLEASYRYTDFKDDALDPSNGIAVSLTAPLLNPFFIKAGVSWGSAGGQDKEGYSFNTVSIGGGVHMAVTPKFHFLGEVGGTYASLDADEDELSFSNGAIYVRPAVRFTPKDFWEIQAGVMVSSADDYDSKVFDISTYFRVFSALDLGVGVDLGDESQSYRGGIRVRW